MYFIYKLSWDGQVERYVGITTNPAARLEQHAGPYAAPKVKAAVARLGRPTMTIIDEALDRDVALSREQYHIDALCAGVEWMGGLNTKVCKEVPAYPDVVEFINVEKTRIVVRQEAEPLDEDALWEVERAKLARRREIACQMLGIAI